MRRAPVITTVVAAALLLSGSVPEAAAPHTQLDFAAASGTPFVPQAAGQAIKQSTARSSAHAEPAAVPTNRAPVATNRSLAVPKNTGTTLTLTASDPDRQRLSYTASSPAHGSLSGTPPNLTYTPNHNFTGFDLVVFRVEDSRGAADQANVYVSVYAPPNHPPTARGDSVRTPEGQPVTISLRARDRDRDPLSYSLLTWSWCRCQVEHGTITGSGSRWTYTPAPGYTGTDFFEFRATDDEGAFADGHIEIHVLPPR
jgi:hypothetical protein